MDGILAVDIGNTCTKVAVVRGDAVCKEETVSTSKARGVDGTHPIVDRIRSLVDEHRPASIAVSSVVSGMSDLLKKHLEKLGLPFYRLRDLVAGVSLAPGMPANIGEDRLANAVAAFHIAQQPCIVVDFGTATNFECVADNGVLLGGMIAPGIDTALHGLAARAPSLSPFLSELFEQGDEARSVVGKTTRRALYVGSIQGHARMVDGLVEDLQVELGPCRVLATGGLAGKVVPLCRRVEETFPHLTLLGISLIVQSAQNS